MWGNDGEEHAMISSGLLVGFHQVVPHLGFSIVAFISRTLVHPSLPLPTFPASVLHLSLLPGKIFLVCPKIGLPLDVQSCPLPALV